MPRNFSSAEDDESKGGSHRCSVAHAVLAAVAGVAATSTSLPAYWLAFRWCGDNTGMRATPTMSGRTWACRHGMNARACVVANRDASTPTCCAGSLA